MSWQVVIHPEAERELRELPRREQEAMHNAIDKLNEAGPVLRFPHLEEFLAEDPGARERWERLEYARAVANRLIAYRAEHDLTQQQLAERVGVQQPHVARLESGEYAPSIPTLRRLARALGIEFHFDITPTDVRMSA